MSRDDAKKTAEEYARAAIASGVAGGVCAATSPAGPVLAGMFSGIAYKAAYDHGPEVAAKAAEAYGKSQDAYREALTKAGSKLPKYGPATRQ